MPVGINFCLYRNTSPSDDVTSMLSTWLTEEGVMSPPLPSVSDYNWTNGDKVFKEWNTKRDGTGTAYQDGDSLPPQGDYDAGFGIYAIWESAPIYVKTNWQTGDTITADKLNHMESGIENANNPFIVTLTPTAQDFSGTMDKTPQEITAAHNAGRQIRIVVPVLGGITGICTEFAPQSDGNVILWCNFVAHFDELGGDVMITVTTSHDQSAYGTKIFPLTPMS